MEAIRHRIILNASQEAVFEAVSTERGLKSWWTSDVEVSLENADYQFGFNDHSVVFRMKTENVEENKYLSMTCLGDYPEWTGTRLIFEISQREDGKVQLDFTHDNWESTSGNFRRCSTDWGHLMYYLKDYVEGRGETPFMS